ncbi:MAG: hypothetical protein FWE36_00480 [Erysipelotrichales bacterium]|nr:hypothetical protein [Erysipelotrichales bacterium]
MKHRKNLWTAAVIVTITNFFVYLAVSQLIEQTFIPYTFFLLFFSNIIFILWVILTAIRKKYWEFLFLWVFIISLVSAFVIWAIIQDALGSRIMLFLFFAPGAFIFPGFVVLFVAEIVYLFKRKNKSEELLK